jgi:hypothetical protein
VVITAPSSIVWQQRYFERVRSPEWRGLKAHLMRYRGNRCERCGDYVPLELHHKSYDRLGNERASDLELVCRACHQEADRERAAEGERRKREAIRVTAINTYATKRFGPDWRNHHDHEWVAAEFDRWLAKKKAETQ